MTVLRACVRCGVPCKDGYCDDHQRKAWEGSRHRERMGLSGGAWETVRRKVLARDMGYCYLCDAPGADHVDHLIELAAGGTSRMDNLASAHSHCHRRKHQDPEWAQKRIEMALKAIGGWGATPNASHGAGTAGGADGARRIRSRGA